MIQGFGKLYHYINYMPRSFEASKSSLIENVELAPCEKKFVSDAKCGASEDQRWSDLEGQRENAVAISEGSPPSLTVFKHVSNADPVRWMWDSWGQNSSFHKAIEEQTSYRAKLDQAVLTFNRCGISEALALLDEGGVLSKEDASQVAAFLFKSNGLDKTKLGEFLGKSGDFQIAVLYHFARLCDFRSLEIDDGLRYLLGKFEPPGEAQQLYRIMYQFACNYVKQNPEKELSIDAAHFLAYAILLLHTDCHNPKIKKKMTKEEFVKSVTQYEHISKSWLEGIYDRIGAARFKLEVTEADQVYSRLTNDPNVSTRILGTFNSILNDAAIHKMKKGCIFKKYCRNGKVKLRHVQLSEDERFILWRSETAKSSEQPRKMLIESITGVTVGSPAKKIQLYNEASDNLSSRTFSLHSDTRALVLCAFNPIDPPVESWTAYLHRKIAKTAKEKEGKSTFTDIQQKLLQQQNEELNRLTLWTELVLPNWELHWNCRGFPVESNASKRLNNSSPIAQDVSDLRISAAIKRKHLQANLRRASQCYESIISSDFEPSRLSCTGFLKREINDTLPAHTQLNRRNCFATPQTKTLLALWYKGIPAGLRGKVWAIAIGNTQRISNHLFQLMKQKLDRLNQESSETFDMDDGEREKISMSNKELPSVWSRLVLLEYVGDFGEQSSRRSEFSQDSRAHNGSDAIAGRIGPGAGEFSKKNEAVEGEALPGHKVPIDLVKNDQAAKEELNNPFGAFDKLSERKRFETFLYSLSVKSFNFLEQILKDARSVLGAFILHRPEVGYMSDLGNIAMMLLLYMEPHVAFQCFVNIIQSFHFMDYLLLPQGFSRRRVRMQFDFFQAIFKSKLPLLYDHFKGLEITPDLYLMGWLVTLFTKILPHRVVCRVWDCFFLKGEVYAFEVALAILKYYEGALLVNSFEGCIMIVHRNADPLDDVYGTFDTKQFFRYSNVCVMPAQCKFCKLPFFLVSSKACNFLGVSDQI